MLQYDVSTEMTKPGCEDKAGPNSKQGSYLTLSVVQGMSYCGYCTADVVLWTPYIGCRIVDTLPRMQYNAYRAVDVV